MTTKTAANSIESWLITHPGVTNIEHRPQLRLADIDMVASITNQSRFNPIDEPTVERYVAALADGALFPAIIVRRITGGRADGEDQLVILGGNHRARAHLDRINRRGDEICAHGRTNSEALAGLWEHDEARIISETTETITKHFGTRPRGWMGRCVLRVWAVRRERSSVRSSKTPLWPARLSKSSNSSRSSKRSS